MGPYSGVVIDASQHQDRRMLIPGLDNSLRIGHKNSNCGSIGSPCDVGLFENPVYTNPLGEEAPLNKKYRNRKVNKGAKPFRDFIWSGNAKQSFYFEQSENTISFDYNDDEAYYYMDHHENKKEGHRLYPVEKDSNSSEQKNIIDFVEKQISNTLNKPRTLKAKATVTRFG